MSDITLLHLTWFNKKVESSVWSGINESVFKIVYLEVGLIDLCVYREN